MAKILGLDLGTNSLGWAITERTEEGYKLVDRGVDIFQEGVNRTQKGEEPTVKTRTEARASRRHYFRRRLRKIELLKVLAANDMCPSLTTEQLDAWRYEKRYPATEEFLLWQRTDDNKDKNPYHDRNTVLTTTLDMSNRQDRHLLGRALYHLAQRRGFLSNRKETAEDEENGKVKSSIGQLTAEMKACGCNYLGEYFYRLYHENKKIRTQYTARKEHYEAEFQAICEKQNLREELRRTLYKAIFFQRPLKSQKGSVGRCTFEKKKARCPISHPRFEEFRMRSFINNIRIKTQLDPEERPLTEAEVEKILPLFYRKSKGNFTFEDIAKKLAGGKKGSYAYRDDRSEAPYRFNFCMSQSVAGCPVTAALKTVFDDDWQTEIHSLYLKGDGKTEAQIVNDVWHALFSFSDDEKLREWAKCNLQLTDKQADEFVKIRMPQSYAALSLNAIDKILPHLRQGRRYDEAVFLANLPAVVPKEVWNDEVRRAEIEASVTDTIANYRRNPYDKFDTKERAIGECLRDCGLTDEQIDSRKLYHPSMIETYKVAQPDQDGIRQLGLPFTSSVRNPMVMRALFRLRALVNRLLKEGRIDENTKVNIEFARELNTANMRRAIEAWQRDNDKKRLKYKEEICEYYKQYGGGAEPTEDDILKYQLWVEQKHICPYTGKKISLCSYTGKEIEIRDFLGASPQFDIEHTVPRSRGGDNSQMNKTLCDAHFNREVKGAKLPSELANHQEIMERIETSFGWKKKIEDLRVQISRTKGNFSTKEKKDQEIQKRHRLQMELDYWEGKYNRFTMTEVPEGFSNRQGVDIGIIGRYARLYLKTVFSNIYIVKGATTADLRKAWGLQAEYEKKNRVNHVHHCIDAVTIACIDGNTYKSWKDFVAETEHYERTESGKRPHFPKPWPTFTEDVKSIADELLVSHHTADNMPKQSRKKLRTRGKIKRNECGEVEYTQGDTARGMLHKENFYGAIKHNDEVKYVIRKLLADKFKETDVDKIVDKAVRECVKAAIERDGFKKAVSQPICFNAEKGVYIKKVRIFAPGITQPIKLKKHRDESRFEYKRSYHVVNDSNYCMAIYEGTNAKGKPVRSFKLINNLEAARYFNGKSGTDHLVPLSDANDNPLKCILRTGTMVLFYENSPEELYECSKKELAKRLYKVKAMANEGRIQFIFHQDARSDDAIKAECGKGISQIDVNNPPAKLRLSISNINAYVEGYDFELTVTGEIIFKH